MHQIFILKKGLQYQKSIHVFVLTNSASLFQGGFVKILLIFLILPYIDKNQSQLGFSYSLIFLLILPMLNIFS